MRIDFASPMQHESLKITIQPTITNQSVWWDSDKSGLTAASTTARVGGGWLASTAVHGDDRGRLAGALWEKLGKDVVIRSRRRRAARS